ncbi:TonB-dependent receptor [Pedobacter hiemivivus]|uniref:TonB-dependent receptor n=1 Tax=Pedobacter hiemivivus TaxID=2530454 RepID=A0A4R0NJI5_9SPHI|nr:TonB-dependent receptor [Pedobacter hiemivivus]TCC99592.1 TonB-dependent receptor [Pedobacter hiemivivus]TKC63612.1 TonB-dependent receptor [Pedobacter hiemivivus]
MKKIKYLFTLFFLFPLILLAQQPVNISGKITDVNNIGLPGVSIKVKGTTVGTFTDSKGSFSLSVPSADAYIQISYVGYLSQELQVNAKRNFAITLQENNNTLNELIVVGYGTQKKATVTGSIATLNTEQITVTKNENVVNMLTGKIPGVRILQKTSEPGGYENTFDIRGFGSPLIVIDGIPRGSGDFSRMDPNEIDNISVLKDAAAAIYGVRAANGVILITTKKGKKDGKYDINYSVNQGWQQFLGMPEGVGAVDYMLLTNEKNKRSFASNFPNNQESTFSYGDMQPWLEGKYPSADWIGAAFNTTSPQIQHNMNVDGGTEKANYFFNLGYMKQDGLFKSGDLDYNRYNFRSNVNVNITRRIRAQILTSGHIDQKNQPFQDLWTIFKYAWSQVPTNQIYANNNPLYPNKMPDDANPVSITDADQVGYKKRTQKNFQGQLTLEYDIPGIEGLKAKGMYNYGYNADDNTDHKRAYKLYTYNAEQDTYAPTVVGSPAYINRSYANSVSILTQLSLNYTKTFNQVHNVSALVLLEESHFKSDNFYAQRNVTIPIDYLFGGEDDQQLGSMNVNGLREEATRSYIGRLNYDYKGKYLAEFSFRRDGSNKFKPGADQWGFFPAGSIGWRISEETFFKNLVPTDILSNLKIRASYGRTGDDSATAFQYISGFNYPTLNPNDNSVWGYFFDGKFYNGAAARALTNPDLTWFTAETKNIGLDFNMFNGKLDGSVDVFRRDMKGLLALRDVQIPGTVGIELPQENLNSNRTEGVEIIVNYRNKIGQFGYNIGGNFSTTRTMDRDVIQGLAGNEYSNWKSSRTNRYTSIWWGKTYAGQFTNYDQIFSHPINTGGGNNNTIPGDYYYQDWNEDGVINEKDDQPIATKDIPLVNYGINLGLSYKNFDLNALFAGATSFYVQYDEQYAEPLMYGRSALTKFLDSWHTVNPNDNVFDPNTQWVPGNYPAMGSPIAEGTKAVQDASYLRLKTLELGYSIPALTLAKVGIKKMRVYANAYNLLTFTKLKDSDPEHPGQIPDASFDHGARGYKYPLNRTFNLGASISF